MGVLWPDYEYLLGVGVDPTLGHARIEGDCSYLGRRERAREGERERDMKGSPYQ